MKTLNENTVRSAARRQGYSVHKSRLRTEYPMNLNNHGHYMLVDANLNAIVMGERYDATLEEIAGYLRS